jgi:hypothetical protein
VQARPIARKWHKLCFEEKQFLYRNCFPEHPDVHKGVPDMTASAESLSTSQSIQDRIEAMFTRDKITAAVLVVALWLTVFFVMFAVRGFIVQKSVEVVCWIGAALLLLFNTASIVAMIKHYGQDKAHIYAIDIRHLDAGR